MGQTVSPAYALRACHTTVAEISQRHVTFNSTYLILSRPRLHRPLEAAETEALAAQWLIRLDADESPATLAQWHTWLSEDTRNHAAYVRIEKAWHRADGLRRACPLEATPTDPDVLARFPGLQPAPHAPTAPLRPRIGLLALAATLAVATMVAATWFHTAQFNHATRQTELGGFERTLLPDGSTVLLNTNSEIQVRFSRRLRAITLTRGEALFTVAPEEGRPFTVSVAGTVVRALGTSFTVRQAESGGIEIVVSRGRVSVTPRASALHLLLTEGDDARIDAAGEAAIGRLGTTDIDHRLAWTRGQIWFNEAALTEAIAEFNRYNNRKFLLADPQLATLRVGGSFAATDPTAFVAALERVFGIQAVSSEDDSGAPVIRLIGRATTPSEATR
jgi:transmembrane sensor